MPNTPTTSFIPKQGPVKRSKQTATRQIHVFAIISYIAFVTSLITAVGLFFYEGYVGKQLEAEVNLLSAEIKGFSDADMERVREFNTRLWQADDRLNKSISLVSVLTALESATVQSAAIDQLSVKKTDDSSVTLAARLTTDTFDSTLFQRGVYERNQIIDSVLIEDLTIVDSPEEGTLASGVTFTALLTVPTKAIPTQVGQTNVESTPDAAVSTTTPEVESAIGSSTEPATGNPETI